MTVNFRVVEKESVDHLYEPFLKDYQAGHSITELRKKYGITRGVWKEWRQKMPLRKEAFNHRPPKHKIYKKKHFGESFIKGNWNGNSTVCRRVNGTRYSYGTYPSRKVAEMVHDELKEFGWDKELAYELVQTYAIPNSRRILSAKLLRRDF